MKKRAGRLPRLLTLGLLAWCSSSCVWVDAAGWGSTPGDYPPELSRSWTRQLPRRGRIVTPAFPHMETLPTEFSLPAVVDGRVFVGTSSGDALALDKESGATLWEIELSKERVVSRAVAGEQVVVFADLAGTLYGRSVEDGAEVWTQPLGVPVLDAMLLVGSRVLVQDAHGALAAVAISDGNLLWKIDGKEPKGLTARAMGGPVADEPGERVFFGRWDGAIQAARVAGGQVLWQVSYGGDREGFQSTDIGLAFAGGALYAARFSGPVFKIRADDGIAVWQNDEVSAAAGPAATFSQVYVPLQGGGMAALDATVGERLKGWGREIPADWGVLSQPRIVGTSGGEWVVAVTTETENRWWPPRVTHSGRVVAIDPVALGQLSWFSKIQTGSYAGVAAGADWVAVVSDRAVAQLWDFSARTDARPDIDYLKNLEENQAAEKPRPEPEEPSWLDKLFEGPRGTGEDGFDNPAE